LIFSPHSSSREFLAALIGKAIPAALNNICPAKTVRDPDCSEILGQSKQ